ncbi:hypothetical protein C8R43DRAFT_1122621 [Mycena crocata]|nr:hypothetical protein C8R43DRAFT_1122621 [Mycena crocata]
MTDSAQFRITTTRLVIGSAPAQRHQYLPRNTFEPNPVGGPKRHHTLFVAFFEFPLSDVSLLWIRCCPAHFGIPATGTLCSSKIARPLCELGAAHRSANFDSSLGVCASGIEFKDHALDPRQLFNITVFDVVHLNPGQNGASVTRRPQILMTFLDFPRTKLRVDGNHGSLAALCAALEILIRFLVFPRTKLRTQFHTLTTSTCNLCGLLDAVPNPTALRAVPPT